MNKVLRFALAAAFVTSAFAMQSCTDEEVGASAGAIAGAIIGGAVASDNGPVVVHTYPSYPSTYCYYDYYGYYRCDHYYPTTTMQFEKVTLQTANNDFVSSDSRVATVAQKYEISNYAATLIVRAITLAQAKDLSGLAEMGMTQKDFNALYKGQALSAERINTVAQKINLPADKTADVLAKMTADVQASRQ